MSMPSVRSLCACNNITWLRLGWVNVDRRNVFNRRSAENVLSAVEVVTGMVKNILVSLYTSLNNDLLLLTLFNSSAIVRNSTDFLLAVIVYVLIKSGSISNSSLR